MPNDFDNLRDRSLLIDFSMGLWYGKATDQAVARKVAEESLSDPAAGKFTKNLMQGVEEYARIQRAGWAARAQHRFHTVPWGDTNRMIRADGFPAYLEAMRIVEKRFWETVDEFIPLYPIVIERARQMKDIGGALGKLFKESDYPDPGQIREKFSFKIQVAALPGGDFRSMVSDDIVEQIEFEARKTTAINLGPAVGEVYARIYDVVVNLSRTLGDGKTVRETTNAAVRKLVEALPRLNVSDDPTIVEMGEKLKELIDPTISRGTDEAAAIASAMEAQIRDYATTSL